MFTLKTLLQLQQYSPLSLLPRDRTAEGTPEIVLFPIHSIIYVGTDKSS